MPEIPWNYTCASPIAVDFINAWAKKLGYSSVTNAEAACNFMVVHEAYIYSAYGYDLSGLVDTVGGGGGASGCVANDNSNTTSCGTATTTGTAYGNLALYNDGWPKPSWQTGVSGIPTDGVRDIPDVSFFAAAGYLSSSAYLMCVSQESSTGQCTYSTTKEPTAQEVGGTSVATPAMAGVMALINQKAGSSQGNPNAELYKLAAKQTYSGCSAENATTGNGCYFNDIDTGNIATPCDEGYLGYASPDCTVTNTADKGRIGILNGYNAGTAYDLATGLGSLNVANVVNSWASSTGSSAATVTVAPATSSLTANQSLSVVVTVASNTAGVTTTPTGSVTLSGGGYTSATATLSGGAYTFTIPGGSLSAGSDTLTVAYGGDTTYASAVGTAVVTVTKLTPTVTVTPSKSTLNSNEQLTVTGAVTGTGGTATGTVTLSGDGYTSAATTLSSGSYSIVIPYNSLTGPTGTYALTVSYSGDATYNATSNSANVTVTYVSLLTPTVTVTSASTTSNSGQSLQVTATVTGTGATPTGSVSLSGGGYSSGTQQLVGGVFVFTIPGNSLNAGTDLLTVAYGGDTNYKSGSGAGSVTVTQSTFTLSASTASPASISAGGSAASTITVTSTNGYSGTVALSCAASSTNPTNTTANTPTCTGSNASSVAAGGTATFTVSNIVATTTTTSALDNPKLPGKGWAGAGGGAVLALLFFLGIPARRRKWLTMLGVLAAMAAMGSMAACGIGGSSRTTTTVQGTTAGTYTFTITGTGTPSVTPTPTATFTVTVN